MKNIIIEVCTGADYRLIYIVVKADGKEVCAFNEEELRSLVEQKQIDLESEDFDFSVINFLEDKGIVSFSKETEVDFDYYEMNV